MNIRRLSIIAMITVVAFSFTSSVLPAYATHGSMASLYSGMNVTCANGVTHNSNSTADLLGQVGYNESLGEEVPDGFYSQIAGKGDFGRIFLDFFVTSSHIADEIFTLEGILVHNDGICGSTSQTSNIPVPSELTITGKCPNMDHNVPSLASENVITFTGINWSAVNGEVSGLDKTRTVCNVATN